MRRTLVGMAAASLTILIGVALATLRPASPPGLPEPAASLPDAKPAEDFDRPTFRQVFRDFDFVGSSAITESIAGECACPHGLKESLPKPDVFEAGRIYAFHYRGAIDNDLLFEALQTRLLSMGLETRVLHGSFTGWRLHTRGLDFQGHGYAGSVTAQMHGTVSESSRQSRPVFSYDYVLTLKERPQ